MQAINGSTFGRGGRALVVIGMHVVVVYLIATSLGIVDVPKFVQPMEASIIEVPQESKPVKQTVVKPDLVEPDLEIPMPDIVPIPEVEVPVEVTSDAAISAAPEAVEAAELQVTKRVAPTYPPASRRLGEEGVVIFRVLVDEKGRPLRVNVIKSSGYERLDDAALRAIQRWAFAPAMQNSQPVRSWSRVQVRFRLDS